MTILNSFFILHLSVKVLVVAGGYYGSYTKISSTETHTLGSDAWSLGSPLPRAIKSFASVSLNDKIYFIGNISHFLHLFHIRV